jgi:GT2 family glycosyltransferase
MLNPLNQTQALLHKNKVIIFNPLAEDSFGLVDLNNNQTLVISDTSGMINPCLTNNNLLDNVNLIYNSDFSEGTSYWQSDIRQDVEFSTDIGIGELILENGHTAYISQAGVEQQGNFKITYLFEPNDELIPLLPNQNYQLSGYFGMHRCNGLLQIELFNRQKKLVESIKIDLPVKVQLYGGKKLEYYYFAKQQFQTGKNITYGKVSIIKNDTLITKDKQANNDSFLFFTRLFLGVVSTDLQGEITWQSSVLNQKAIKRLHEYQLNKTPYLLIDIPPNIIDGQLHRLQVVNTETSEIINPEPFLYQNQIKFTGEIEKIQDSYIFGWASYDLSEISMTVQLVIDGAITNSKTIANLPHVEGDCGFRLTIPALYLDGRVHHIVVKDDETGIVIAEVVEITSYISTPWNALQQHSNPPFPAYLAPMASDRYRSLELNLAAFAKQELSGQYIKNISAWHQQLIQGFDKSQKNYSELRFSIHEKPLISVIIPVHNKFAVTYNCLVALLFAYNQASFEVIVVDDGSEDDTLDLPSLVEGITYLRNETAQGFILSCNFGAKFAKGEYLVFLNNDTEPTAKWLDEMLFVFDNFTNVGLVGSKLVYPNGELQEAGGIVWGTGDPWNYGRKGNANDPKYNYTRQVDYVSGASLMIHRDLWSEVGGFSEELCPAYFEDTDLSFKVKALKKRVVYTPFSKVYHYEGISSGTSVASGMKRYQEINRPKFKRKWSSLYQNNGEVGKDVDLNKDRGIRYRALFIDLQTPRPDQDAGSYAAVQEIRLFQSLGFKVTFIPENIAYLGIYTENLQRLGVEMIYAPFYLTVEKFLEERGEEFNVVYITRYNCVEKNLLNVRQYAPKAKVMFCNADLHFLRVFREAIYQKDQSKLKEGIKIRDIELSLMRKVDLTLSYNKVEHSVVFSYNLDQTNIVTCPWVSDLVENVPPFEKRKSIAFLGGFRHQPNVDAVKFFIQSVMPLIRQNLPGVKFVVYGSSPPEELEKMGRDDVIIEGYVESVEDVYNSCRVFVAPLLFGAGIKGKVVDALAHGIPQVLSPVAAEGTGVRDGLEVFIAEKPEEWVDKIVKLYNNQKLWENMSQSAQEYARLNFSFEKGRKLMGEALEAVEVYPNYDESYFVYEKAR